MKPFAMAMFPVTRGQWRRVSTFPQVLNTLQSLTNAPSEWDNSLPVDAVWWAEADEFCRRLQRYTGRAYRLPSEAEWEYACRAGTTTKYHFGDHISVQVANYNDGEVRPLVLTPTGSKQAPNRYGLHDMHGAVLEWCADGVHNNYEGAPVDGSAWTGSSDPLSRIARGGMYLYSSGVGWRVPAPSA